MDKNYLLVSKYFTASDGVRLRYLKTQNGKEKEWVIFAHGAGGDATAWAKIQKIFHEAGYGSIAIDLRGHGLSDDPIDSGAYAFERLAKDIEEIIAEQKLENVVLVGHCFGGMAAMVLAARAPKYLTKLVLVDTNDIPSFFGFPNFYSSRMSKLIRLLAGVFPPGKKRVRPSYEVFVGTKDMSLKRFISDVRYTSARSYLYCYADLFEFNGVDLLGNINARTLVVCGENDIIFPPKVSKQLAASIRNADLVIVPRENHIIVINNPGELSNIIIEFIKRI